jgi:hypothetical protein
LFCDGSVKSIPYEVNDEIHRRLSNRSDAIDRRAVDISNL